MSLRPKLCLHWGHRPQKQPQKEKKDTVPGRKVIADAGHAEHMQALRDDRLLAIGLAQRAREAFPRDLEHLFVHWIVRIILHQILVLFHCLLLSIIFPLKKNNLHTTSNNGNFFISPSLSWFYWTKVPSQLSQKSAGLLGHPFWRHFWDPLYYFPANKIDTCTCRIWFSTLHTAVTLASSWVFRFLITSSDAANSTWMW